MAVKDLKNVTDRCRKCRRLATNDVSLKGLYSERHKYAHCQWQSHNYESSLLREVRQLFSYWSIYPYTLKGKLNM